MWSIDEKCLYWTRFLWWYLEARCNFDIIRKINTSQPCSIFSKSDILILYRLSNSRNRSCFMVGLFFGRSSSISVLLYLKSWKISKIKSSRGKLEKIYCISLKLCKEKRTINGCEGKEIAWISIKIWCGRKIALLPWNILGKMARSFRHRQCSYCLWCVFVIKG